MIDLDDNYYHAWYNNKRIDVEQLLDENCRLINDDVWNLVAMSIWDEVGNYVIPCKQFIKDEVAFDQLR